MLSFNFLAWGNAGQDSRPIYVFLPPSLPPPVLSSYSESHICNLHFIVFTLKRSRETDEINFNVFYLIQNIKTVKAV